MKRRLPVSILAAIAALVLAASRRRTRTSAAGRLNESGLHACGAD
jgi:hypothetical protein